MQKVLSIFGIFLIVTTSYAQTLSADEQAKIDKQFVEIKKWAGDAAIVKAVKDSNSAPANKDMNQEKWEKLSLLDPFVRAFTKNSAAEELKKLKGAAVTEAFVSNSRGEKVAFLAKTTNWNHQGKPKHDDPMKGKDWTGKVELDASTGKNQIQISVPIKDGETVIGSLVVGYSVDDI